MKRFLTLARTLALVLLPLIATTMIATSATAQPLHGHPQVIRYNSPSDWPKIFDGQMHWDKFDAIQTQHCVHLQTQIPYGADLNDDAFDIKFSMLMFHCASRVTALFDGDNQANVTWDDGVTFPVMGDPSKLLTFTGTWHFDPKRLGRFHHKHGWTQVRFEATMVFTSGDVGYHNFWWSYYSIADLSAPEDLPPGGFGPVLSVRNTIFPMNGTSFGDMVMEVEDWLPLLPIKAPWFFRVSAYNYTSVAPCCPNGLLEQRRDMDFHNGVPGTVIVSLPHDQQGFSPLTLVIDPTTMTPGPHKDGVFWKSTFNGQTIAALLAFSYVVGDGGTPPPPAWATLSGLFQQLGNMEQFRFCPTSSPMNCQAYVKQP